MGLLSRKETVLERSDVRIGDVDPTNETGTGYKNIITFEFGVKRNRMLRAHITSDTPVDFVIAYEGGLMAVHREGVMDAELGPVPTKGSKGMGLIVGIYPGDKATFSVTAWTDSR